MSQLLKIQVGRPQAETAPLALDVSFLNTATFNDKALRFEIIGLFRQQIKTLTDQLRMPMDQAGWRYLTHTLKGSASAVGACQLAGLADEWELGSFPADMGLREAYADQLVEALAAFDAVVADQHLA